MQKRYIRNNSLLVRNLTLSMGLSVGFVSWAVEQNFPHELQYLKKPIDALCFSDLANNAQLIDLKRCGIKKNKFVITGQTESLIKRGFIGFDWKDPTLSYPMQGYSYYQVFAAGNHQYWLYSVNNGGGTGEFTAVNLVKRKNNESLKINTVMGGDRCNGGVYEVHAKANHLLFSVNLTAFDLLPLVDKTTHQLNAYNDLASCAVCCVAKAVYEVDSRLKPKLKYVQLNNQFTGSSEMPEQGKYQGCFNTLFASYVAKGNATLAPTQLNQFVREFYSTCLKN